MNFSVSLMVVICFGSAISYTLADRGSSRLLRAVSKMTASTAFVFIALKCGALATSYGKLVLLGLVFGWLGDAFLLSRKKRPFLIGLAAFLLGHAAYAAAFAARPLNSAAFAASAAVMTVFAAAIIAWLRPHLSAPFAIAVPVYVAVICAMTVLAFTQWAGGGPALAAVGAAAFTASDISVARERFVHSSRANQAWGLPLYYVAQILLAMSVR